MTPAAVAGRWAAPLLWMAALFAASAQAAVRVPGPDWGLHAAAYLVLGLLVARALDPGAGLNAGRAALAVALCVAYGASDEWHQSFVPGRRAELSDLAMDAVGGLLGVAAHGRWPALRR